MNASVKTHFINCVFISKYCCIFMTFASLCRILTAGLQIMNTWLRRSPTGTVLLTFRIAIREIKLSFCYLVTPLRIWFAYVVEYMVVQLGKLLLLYLTYKCMSESVCVCKTHTTSKAVYLCNPYLSLLSYIIIRIGGTKEMLSRGCEILDPSTRVKIETPFRTFPISQDGKSSYRSFVPSWTPILLSSVLNSPERKV
jgi:hypothetical protein